MYARPGLYVNGLVLNDTIATTCSITVDAFDGGTVWTSRAATTALGGSVVPAATDDDLTRFDQGNLFVFATPGRYRMSGTINGLAFDPVEFTVNPDPRDLFDEAEAAAAGLTKDELYTTEVGYDIVLVTKQSNADGRAIDFDAARIDVSNPRIYQYGTSGTYAGMISLATEPLAGTLGTGMGPALTFSRLLLELLPPRRRILIVPVAVGGTPFEGSAPFGTWKVGRVDATNLTDAAITRVNLARAAVAAEGFSSRVVAVLGIHGETDGDNGTSAAAYSADEDAFIEYLRAQLATPDLIYVAGGMVPEYLSTGTRAAIRAVQIDTPRRKVRTGYADGVSGGSRGDGNHYNAFGQRQLARSMFRAFQRAQANVLGTAPVTPVGVAAVQSGTSVTVTWTPPTARVTDYALQYSVNNNDWVTVARAQSIDPSATITGLTTGSTVRVQVASLNEQGTSAYSAPVSVTLIVAPGQVVGLATGTVTFNSVPLTWTATAGATSYLVEDKQNSSGTWLTFGTVTTNAATVTGLADGVQYNFRVTAINVGGSGPVSATVSATTTALAAIFDALTATAWNGVSMRKLRAAYAGAACRVRRDSDNTEMDIPFLGSNLDVLALTNFVGTANGYLVTWYDQGTAGTRNYTQTNVLYQPIIVENGVVNTINGVPVPRFDGTDDHLLSTAGLYAAGAASGMYVAKSVNGGLANAVILDESVVASSNGQYNMARQSSSGAQIAQFIQNSAGTTLLTITQSAIAPAPFNNTQRQFSFTDSGSSFAKFVDGATVTALPYTRSGTLVPDTASLGARARGATISNPWPGFVAEVIKFTSAVGTSDRQAIEASQKAYFATP